MKTKNIIIATCSIVIVSLVVIALLLLKTPKYEVTFTTDNEVYETIEVKEDGTIDEPSVPTKEGYKFVGWYLDGVKFDFSTKITKNMKLVAKWVKDIDEDDESTLNTTTTKVTTTKKKITKKKTTKKITTTNKVETTTTKPVEVIVTTKAATTTKIPTTTKVTTKDNIHYVWEVLRDPDTEEADIAGQYNLYLLKNDTKVSGTCDITFNSGKTITIEVPLTGYTTFKSIVAKIDNIKVK